MTNQKPRENDRVMTEQHPTMTEEAAREIVSRRGISEGNKSCRCWDHIEYYKAKSLLAGIELERRRVEPLVEAGNRLAAITECFCDDLVAYKGVCETCQWKAVVEAYRTPLERKGWEA